MKGQNWREPFFKIHDEIWSVINARNLRIPFQEGFFQREIFAFSEKPVREALLNVVTHRDYTLGKRSIFINASPLEFVIESPGGFLPGITPENVLYKREWRNRCVAETFERAGLVERSGQGMDDIFEKTIREGKGLPDLFESDDFSVRLKIPAQVKDRNFILFLEKIAQEKQITFSFEEIYALETIREKNKVSSITGAMKDILEAKQEDLDAFLEHLPIVAGQDGLLVLVNGEVIGLDRVSCSAAFRMLHPKLIRSYVMDALTEKPAKGKEASRKKTDAFLKKILQCTEHPFDSVGYGRDYRYEGKKIVGSALVHENTVIHMAFFQITETENAGRMSPVSRRRAYRTNQ